MTESIPWKVLYWTSERLMIHRRALVAGLILGFLLGIDVTCAILFIIEGLAK